VGPEKADCQLVGSAPGAPAGNRPRGCLHQYQSRFGEVFDDRDSSNHGCSSLVWFTTSSLTSRIPRA
jgi:hypothetical protein